MQKGEGGFWKKSFEGMAKATAGKELSRCGYGDR